MLARKPGTCLPSEAKTWRTSPAELLGYKSGSRRYPELTQDMMREQALRMLLPLIQSGRSVTGRLEPPARSGERGPSI